MNKKEREAIEEAIDLLEREVRYNGKGFWIESVYVSQDDDITEALRILRRIIKSKGE
nr:MAG TPA: Small acid-soluble spore protein H family [Caudoviricetes sp.]